LRWAVPAIALAGLALSALAAWWDHVHVRALEELRFARAVDSYINELQSRFRSREVLMETAAAMFNPGVPLRPGALGRYGRAFLTLSQDVTAVSWIPRVPAERQPDVLRIIASMGVSDPLVFGQERRRLDLAQLPYVAHVILDVEPSDSAPVLLGGSPSDWPERRAIIEKAETRRQVLTAGPTRLFQPPNPYAFLLYAPVFSTTGEYLGVLSFAYRVDRLFTTENNIVRQDIPLTFDVLDAGDRTVLLRVEANGTLGEPVVPIRQQQPSTIDRTVEFGGFPMTLTFRPSSAAGDTQRTLAIAAGGLALTFSLCLLVTFIIRNSERLAQEVLARTEAESRLGVLLGDLNHRVRNILTVVQTIVTQGLRTAPDTATAKEVISGRLRALTNSMTLLHRADWKGVELADIVQAELAPYSARVNASGPQALLDARRAQALTMIIHELATNSAKYGALSVAGQVEITWLRPIDAGLEILWRESGGPPVKPPSNPGFGTRLITTLAEQDLGGKCQLVFDREGLRCQITCSTLT
jgi:two-component sensor histidine kinase/CHASE1-domain containing sensor protein